MDNLLKNSTLKKILIKKGLSENDFAKFSSLLKTKKFKDIIKLDDWNELVFNLEDLWSSYGDVKPLIEIFNIIKNDNSYLSYLPYISDLNGEYKDFKNIIADSMNISGYTIITKDFSFYDKIS